MKTLLLVAFAAAAVAVGSAPAVRAAAGECGLPAAAPLWIDYGEASVKPDTRAVLMKPGVVVATSGTPVPQAFRTAGVPTTYFELHLDRVAGEPADPVDPSAIVANADGLYDRASKSTACTTPWITLNELQGSNLAMPWGANNSVYRADVMTLVQRLAARGAHPVLLVHGDPTFAGDTAQWWKTASQSALIVYEAYYDASSIYPLGPLVANRRMRLGMRFVLNGFQSAGVPASRLGFMLGFHSAQTPGIAGRQGLEPTDAWLRVVKWESLAAKQVAADTGVPLLMSWGWGTFGPESVDDDKPAAACTWLWARDQSLCDAPAIGGPTFNRSLVEGQIVLPPGDVCSYDGGRITLASVQRLMRLTRDPKLALTAQFVRSVLMRGVPVSNAAVLALEQRVVKQRFRGNLPAYEKALARRGADRQIARGVIADVLRRRGTTFDDVAARLASAGANAICLRDDLPGAGEPLAVGNARDIAAVPLAKFLPFLFGDTTAPASPSGPTAVRTGARVTLTWTSGADRDLAGYDVYRSLPDGTTSKLNTVALVGRTTWTDVGSPSGASYSLRAVDLSGNASAPSTTATP